MTWFKTIKKRLLNKAGYCYYFAHIPKTAGTSFIVLLDRFFSVGDICPPQLWREVKDIETLKKQDYELFRGHFGGGGAKLLTDREIRNLTILRHPVDLAYSTYEFVKREKNTVVHDLVTAENFSFEDFLSHPKTAPLVSNRMVRNLSFDFIEDTTAQEVFLSPETVHYLQPLMQQQQQPLTDGERLQRAKEFIAGCFWFGLLERFDEAMRLLSYGFVTPAIGQTQKLNKQHKRPVISDTARQRVLALNQEDLALYDYGESLFDQRYAVMMAAIGGEVLMPAAQQDELLDGYYKRQFLAHHALNLADEIDFTAADCLWGQQWHRREWIASEQAYFRWSGPGEVSAIDFWLKPKDVNIQIHIINAPTSTWLDELQISVNEQAVAWQSDDTGVVRTLTIACPKKLIHNNGFLRLAFHGAPLQRHSEAFGSDDNRWVGFALKWVKIKS